MLRYAKSSTQGRELLTSSLKGPGVNIHEIFDAARATSPCVVFFDELDLISAARGGSSANAGSAIYHQFLVEMDSMNSGENVFIIGATSHPELIDATFLRHGRLDQLIQVPMPNEETRLFILKANLKISPVAPDIDLTLVAKKTVGFSGANLKIFCQQVAEFAIRDSIYAKIKSGRDKSARPLITRWVL